MALLVLEKLTKISPNKKPTVGMQAGAAIQRNYVVKLGTYVP